MAARTVGQRPSIGFFSQIEDGALPANGENSTPLDPEGPIFM